MLISAARLKRELLTKNGLNMSVWIKIFLVLRRNSFYLLIQSVVSLIRDKILNDPMVLVDLTLAFIMSDALRNL